VNIECLRSFLEVARTGSFSRAAAALGVTQSTVSARIKTLEEQLDQRLFVRGPSGIALTAAGRRLLRHADVAVRAWQQARLAVALPAGLRASVTLGVQPNLAKWLAPLWLEEMRTAAPEVALGVDADYSGPLMQRLDDGLLDVAVMYAPRARPGLRSRPLIEQELVLVSTSARTLTTGWREDYVLVDWTYTFRLAHAEAFPDMETPTITVGLPDIALDHLLAAGGSAYLPRPLVEPLARAGRLFLVEGAPAFRLPAYLVHPAEPLDPDLQTIAITALERAAAPR